MTWKPKHGIPTSTEQRLCNMEISSAGLTKGRTLLNSFYSYKRDTSVNTFMKKLKEMKIKPLDVLDVKPNTIQILKHRPERKKPNDKQPAKLHSRRSVAQRLTTTSWTRKTLDAFKDSQECGELTNLVCGRGSPPEQRFTAEQTVHASLHD